MKPIRLIQISNGVGSGNIGDELMAQEFWKLLPAEVSLDVAVLPEARRYRGTYPGRHTYYPATPGYYPATPGPVLAPDAPGLLVGDTPVGEFEGLGYPLETVGPQISAFTRRGLPVDAIGVGVDRLHQPAARELFAKHYAGIRSWTVRSEACREALLDLGTAPEKIRVAADLAWLFTPGTETDEWAQAMWRSLGVRAQQPLVAINLVHQAVQMAGVGMEGIARILDHLVGETGYQVAFLPNESRPGPYFDAGAAAAVRGLMREPSVEVPLDYYTPQEMVSLLRPVSVVLSQRYHMAIEAILAGTIPVCLPRGPKLSALAGEFALPTAGWSAESILASVRLSMARRGVRLRELAKRRERHRARAGEALSFLAGYLSKGAGEPKRRAGVKRVAVIHLGGLGDLVLASGFFQALRRRYPRASLELFCRSGFAGVAELFPAPPDRVRPVRLQPASYDEPGPALDAALQELEAELADWRPDVVVAAELEPTWLSWYLASRWGAPENLACTRLSAPRGLLRVLLHAAGWTLVEFDGPAWDAELMEGERYARLAAALDARDGAMPEWRMSRAQQQQTQAFLAEQGLEAGGYVVCFPLGAPSTLVKRWPAESFSAALERTTDQFALPVLLTGEASEREALLAQADDLCRRGAKAAVFAGSAADLVLLAGLLASAKFFLGNDTGPAHLAQAYGTPGVVIFGGGTWPHYRPWGRGAVGVVHPLACFGCGWDCAFGQPICLAGVTVDAVVRGVESARENPAGPAQVVTLATASAELQVLAGSAAKYYRLVQAERLARVATLVETVYARKVPELELPAPEGQRAGAEGVGGGEPSARDGQVPHIRVLAAGAAIQIPADSRPARGELPAPGGAVGWQAGGGGVEPEDREEAPAGCILTRAGESAALPGVHPPLSPEARWSAIAEIWPKRWAEAESAAEHRLELIDVISKQLEELRTQTDARQLALENADSLLRRQQLEICELRAGHAERLVAIEEANVLLGRQQEEIVELRAGHAERLVAIEEANELLRRQQAEITELRAGHAERLVALEEANVLLGRQQEEIVELRAGQAERLVAIEEANLLLRQQQAEISELRGGYAQRLVAIEEANVLLRRQQEEIAELRAGHAERLAAIEEANDLLGRQQEEIVELRAGQAERLAAIEEANLLLRQQQEEISELRGGYAQRLVAIEEANVLLRRQQEEIAELRAGHAERLVAIEEANVLLGRQQEEIVELRAGQAERLAAIEEANLLLRQQQEEISELRGGYAQRLVAIEEANVLLRRQQEEMVELRAGHAERLVAIEEANVLLGRQQEEISELRGGYAQRLVAIEEANVLLRRQQEEMVELRAGHAERLVAIEEANVLLGRQQEEIVELRAGQAERLAAIEEANLLLRQQQEEISELRGGYAQRLVAIEEANVLLRRQQEEMVELRAGHAERLVAIEEANVLLGRQQEEISELRGGYAQRLAAIEEANVLLRRQQAEITELRAGHAERLVAIEEANLLLRQQQEEISELRGGYAQRLVAIEEANALLRRQQAEITELRAGHAERLVAIEEANVLLGRQQAEITELRAGHAERLVAIEEANVLLGRQQEEIVELRAGHAERLVAIEEANVLLGRQQEEIVELRAGHAERLVAIEEANALLRDRQCQVVQLNAIIEALRDESAQHANRAAEQSQAAAERLAALTLAQETLLTQGRQLAIYETAAADRLVALEATAGALEAETTRRSLLAEDLNSVRAVLEEARRQQDAEREGWRQRAATLEAERGEEQRNSRCLAEQLIALRGDLDRITAERDRHRRSVEELTVSERELRQEILARQSESLLHSIIRLCSRRNA